MASITVTVYKINGQYFPDGCEKKISCNGVKSLNQNVSLQMPSPVPLTCDEDQPGAVVTEILEMPNGDKWSIEQSENGFVQDCIEATPQNEACCISVIDLDDENVDDSQYNTIQITPNGKIFFVPKDPSEDYILLKDSVVAGDSVLKKSAISDLASLNSTSAKLVQVDGVGLYAWVNSVLVTNGYNIVAGSVGTGVWVLVNSAPSARKIAQSYPIIAELLPGVIAAGNEPNTKNDAMATATIANVGGYDNVIVTGSTAASWIKFPNQTICDNSYKAKLLIKVNTLGATAPLVGIGGLILQETSDTGGAWGNMAYVNLLTKVPYQINENGNNVALSLTTASAGTLVANGDILEIVFDNDAYNGNYTFTVRNVSTNEIVTAKRSLTPVQARSFSLSVRCLSLILADGTYTILKYEVKSSVPSGNLASLIGDSYASGYNLPGNQNVVSLLQAALPAESIGSYASNGAYTTSMRKHQLKEVMKVRPRYVLFLHILQMYWGYFDDGDANQTIFDTDMDIMLKSIIGYGGVPVLFKWQTSGGGYLTAGPGGAGAPAAWNSKVDTLVGTYPQIKVVDLTAQALVFNSSSHPNATDNQKITRKIVEFFIANGF